jgi:hypothetical protein
MLTFKIRRKPGKEALQNDLLGKIYQLQDLNGDIQHELELIAQVVVDQYSLSARGYLVMLM